MKASFDGARRNLAHSFNTLARTKITSEQREHLRKLRTDIAGLLCMYDKSAQPGDCNCLIDIVPLVEV